MTSLPDFGQSKPLQWLMAASRFCPIRREAALNPSGPRFQARDYYTRFIGLVFVYALAFKERW
jgi:hypothetical protein